jgi:head-tail adaptor
MRFRNDVTPDRRLVWNDNGTDRVLNIESVIDIDNARIELDIECKEVVQ